MNKLMEIGIAWIRAARPNDAQKQIALYRLSVCDTCDQKEERGGDDKFYCASCGCPLEKKVFSPIYGPDACPLGKWDV